MAGLTSLAAPIIISSILFLNAYCSPINISPQSVPDSLVQSAINSLNADSPTQHTYKGGNLISAQKLLGPEFVVYKLTLDLDTVCAEGSSSCSREACAIDLKYRSGEIEVNRNSIQCMYLYPQTAAQEDVQQSEGVLQESSQQVENAADNAEVVGKQVSQKTLELDHEVEAAASSQRALDLDSSDNRPFIAVRAQNANYCPGCAYELNPNLAGLAAFGMQALDMMDRLGQNDFKHKLIRILKVTRAVPPGSSAVRYELLAEIGESNCLKTTLIDRSECSLQSNIPVRVCLVTFEERPWQQSARQVVRNNCTEPSDLENEINAGLNPGLTSNSYLVGNVARDQPERVDSVQEVIGKTAHIDQLAQEGKIGTYGSLIDEILEVPVSKATTEFTATQVPFFEGILPRENGASDQVLRHPNESPNSETVQGVSYGVPVATEAPFVKVELQRNTDRPQFQGFVNKEKEFDDFLSDFDVPLKRNSVGEENNDNRQPVAEEVIRSQNVHRENTAGSSSSEEDSSSESNSRETHSSQPGEDKDYIVNPQRRKRALTNIPDSGAILMKQLAQKAIETLDNIDQDDDKRVLVNILESKRQQVDGYLYYLILEVAATECKEKTKIESDIDCLKKITGPIKICKVQIHTAEKNPLLSARVVKSECSKEMTKSKIVRNKRALFGSDDSVSTDNEDVKKYANIGMQKFSEQSAWTNEPILVTITSATKQVVSGSLYKIDITIGTSNCAKGTKNNCQLQAGSELKECKVTAWSRPWIVENRLEITINCSSKNRRKRSLRGKNYSQKMLEQSMYLKNERLFNEFTAKYNRSYLTMAERKNRMKIFQQNMMMVQELQRNEQGTAIYGVSMFADLTTEEFKRQYLGLKPELRLDNEIPIPMAEIPNITIPETYDWRDYNVVTPVKNQGSCGSCWAFSVTGNVEGQYALRHGSLLSLSEQELVDCDTLDQGCSGGLPDNAYRAIEKLGGLELESDYPYDAENEVCHFDKKQARVKVVSAVNITSNETQMAQWLVQNGPISIGINANAMQFYMGGVSHPYKFLCNPNNLDHGVLIVGYGTHTYPIFKKVLPYWTIKNSWGPLWGEKGYYRVYRGDGTCGVNQMASSAVVA